MPGSCRIGIDEPPGAPGRTGHGNASPISPRRGVRGNAGGAVSTAARTDAHWICALTKIWQSCLLSEGWPSARPGGRSSHCTGVPGTLAIASSEGKESKRPARPRRPLMLSALSSKFILPSPVNRLPIRCSRTTDASRHRIVARTMERRIEVRFRRHANVRELPPASRGSRWTAGTPPHGCSPVGAPAEYPTSREYGERAGERRGGRTHRGEAGRTEPADPGGGVGERCPHAPLAERSFLAPGRVLPASFDTGGNAGDCLAVSGGWALDPGGMWQPEARPANPNVMAVHRLGLAETPLAFDESRRYQSPLPAAPAVAWGLGWFGRDPLQSSEGFPPRSDGRYDTGGTTWRLHRPKRRPLRPQRPRPGDPHTREATLRWARGPVNAGRRDPRSPLPSRHHRAGNGPSASRCQPANR